MSHGAVIALATLEFEGNDLVVLVLVDNLGLDAGSRDERGTKIDLVTVHDEQDVAEGGLFAGFDIKFLDTQDVSLGDAVLFAAGLDDCVGHGKIFGKRSERMPRKRWIDNNIFVFFSLAGGPSHRMITDPSVCSGGEMADTYV